MSSFILIVVFFTLASALASKSGYQFYKPISSPYYSNETSEMYGNYSYNYQNDYSYRVRYFKAIDLNLKLNIDIKLSIPLPSDEGFDGSVDIDIPITITISNKTLIKVPYPNKPIRIPLYYPVIKLPNIYGHQSQSYSGNHQYSYMDDDYGQAASPMDSLYNSQMHHHHKRSLAANSALHRFEIFSSIENSLDKYGFNGRSCVLLAVCQMAQKELLIESVFHEVLEHLLSVSRSVDNEDLLRDYFEAEKFGENSHDCENLYRCGFSLFERLQL